MGEGRWSQGVVAIVASTLLLSGCFSGGPAGGSSGAPSASGGSGPGVQAPSTCGLSLEGESCARLEDCTCPLRCVDQMCVDMCKSIEQEYGQLLDRRTYCTYTGDCAAAPTLPGAQDDLYSGIHRFLPLDVVAEMDRLVEQWASFGCGNGEESTRGTNPTYCNVEYGWCEFM